MNICKAVTAAAIAYFAVQFHRPPAAHDTIRVRGVIEQVHNDNLLIIKSLDGPELQPKLPLGIHISATVLMYMASLSQGSFVSVGTLR